MTTRIICVVQQKGGVAKTTTACSIAHALALAGQETLLIDLDPQGQDAVMLGMNSEMGAFYFLTADPDSPQSVQAVRQWVRSTGRQGLSLIAGNQMTAAGQMLMSMPTERPVSHLRSLLRPFVRQQYEYVIFDTSPSVGGLQERAAWAADLVIVPVATEFSSLDSLKKTVAMLTDMRDKKGWKGGILGILPTFYDDQTRESRSSLEDLKRQYQSLVLSPIHRATVLRECWAEGQTIFEKDPTSRAAQEYQQLVAHILRY